MKPSSRRIAINMGGGYVPGLNSVITGAVLAANELGWEAVGIQDGFDGLLFPERYPEGGVIPLSPSTVREFVTGAGSILGTAPSADPFRVRSVNAENQVEEVDRSDELLQALRARGIEAAVSVAGARTLSVLFRLHRKGLKSVCVPKSVENDVAATQLSFGFNSALSYTVETLDRVRMAARAARKIGVVEVLGEHAGWLALQSGIAVCADAVLIPEIPYDLKKVAVKLRSNAAAGRPYGLVVVAEGATSATPGEPQQDNPLRKSLSPWATGPEGGFVIEKSGYAARSVALHLQRLTDCETYPLALGQLCNGGAPTAVDRQLGLAYGATAVRAIQEGQAGVMVAFEPPNLRFVPFEEAINKVRTVPADSIFVQIARSLGINLGGDQ
jgi:ATP-dependent phosphofructokinase / diphosphate-dependent phosphofructokinase